ncbi:MAG: hypothetical protein SFZ03_06095 [Candidatus Melainabacteria bacterium]|nr:hypothetical protein [Candidatus Melainabacteria bacterium]
MCIWFVLLCLLLWALFAFQAPFDRFGWLMIVGAAYMAGFLDARRTLKADADTERVTPPADTPEESAAATPF